MAKIELQESKFFARIETGKQNRFRKFPPICIDRCLAERSTGRVLSCDYYDSLHFTNDFGRSIARMVGIRNLRCLVLISDDLNGMLFFS